MYSLRINFKKSVFYTFHQIKLFTWWFINKSDVKNSLQNSHGNKAKLFSVEIVGPNIII